VRKPRRFGRYLPRRCIRSIEILLQPGSCISLSIPSGEASASSKAFLSKCPSDSTLAVICVHLIGWLRQRLQHCAFYYAGVSDTPRLSTFVKRILLFIRVTFNISQWLTIGIKMKNDGTSYYNYQLSSLYTAYRTAQFK